MSARIIPIISPHGSKQPSISFEEFDVCEDDPDEELFFLSASFDSSLKSLSPDDAGENIKMLSSIEIAPACSFLFIIVTPLLPDRITGNLSGNFFFARS